MEGSQELDLTTVLRSMFKAISEMQSTLAAMSNVILSLEDSLNESFDKAVDLKVQQELMTKEVIRAEGECLKR